MKICRDLKQGKLLWEKHSKNENLWQKWEIAKSFYTEDKEIYFIYDDNNLLPLWKNDGLFEFFGGNFMEDRILWIEKEDFEKFFDSIPVPAALFYINEKSAESLNLRNMVKGNYYYYLDSKSIEFSFENYLKSFSKKHRHNLVYDLKKIASAVEIEWGEDKHFDEFIKFNLSRFKEESTFTTEKDILEMKNFLNILAEHGFLITLNIYKDGKVVGIEYAAFHDGIYYVLNGGYDFSIKNLGKLLIAEHIKNALRLKADQVNFMSGEGNDWKELWNFQRGLYYELHKE